MTLLERINYIGTMLTSLESNLMRPYALPRALVALEVGAIQDELETLRIQVEQQEEPPVYT